MKRYRLIAFVFLRRSAEKSPGSSKKPSLTWEVSKVLKVFVSISIVLAIYTGTNLSVRCQSTAEYKVYDAVVKYMFRDGITRFDMNAKVDQIVIRDRTHSDYARGTDKEDWEQVKIRLSSLNDETIAGYESVRKDEVRLKAVLDVPFNYSFISDEQLAVPFGRARLSTGSMDQWNEFYRLYPKSGGVISFSRVGFDKTRQSALVYFVNWCGPLCGTGTYVHLISRDTEWSVNATGMMWIS